MPFLLINNRIAHKDSLSYLISWNASLWFYNKNSKTTCAWAFQVSHLTSPTPLMGKMIVALPDFSHHAMTLGKRILVLGVYIVIESLDKMLFLVTSIWNPKLSPNVKQNTITIVHLVHLLTLQAQIHSKVLNPQTI